VANPLHLRCVVVPPAPAPYRDPLFRALARRLDLTVVYQSASQPSWDVGAEWFAGAGVGAGSGSGPRSGSRGYPSRHLRSRQRRRPGRTPVMWPAGLERALHEADPDVVIVSEYGPASLRALAWCRRHGRAHVVFTECTPEIDVMLSSPQLRLHRWVARHADGVIAVSSAARARLLAFGVPAERIAVALQSADLAPVRAATPECDGRQVNGHVPLTVLSVSRLVPDKNLATLLQAYAEAGLSADRAQVEIVGTGFLEDELRALALRLGVPVRFLGHVAPSELPARYARADVFAAVSTYEPFGVAIREAAAAGLPIICSRVAGAAGDVAVGGRNAILVEPRSVSEVAGALTRLTADAELRRRMGAESRAVDAATDGHDVDAFVGAVVAAARARGRYEGEGEGGGEGDRR